MLHGTLVPNDVGWPGVSFSSFLLRHRWSLNGERFHRLDYTWIDQNRRPVKLAAPTYIDYVMTWVQNLLDDEATFPTKAGASIPFTLTLTLIDSSID